MQPVRGERDQAVARGDRLAVDRPLAVHDAHNRPGQVELAELVDIGHVGGLSAEQRDPRVAAGVGNAGDDRRLALLAEPVARQVVEEEERLRAGGQNVVDAVVDEIAPHSVETLRQAGDEHLGAHPVGGGDQRRALQPIDAAEVEEPAERAHRAQLLGPPRALRQLAVALGQPVVGVDIHARRAVAGRAVGRGRSDGGAGGVAHGLRCGASWIGAAPLPLRSSASLSISSCTGTGYSPVKQARQDGLPSSTARSSPSMLR